ncbi:MAG: hypothetical protein ABWY36_05425 [Leifsonia sp.]
MNGVTVITREEARDRWRIGRRVALVREDHKPGSWTPWSSEAIRAWGHQTFEAYELERIQSIRNSGLEGVWVKPIPSRETTNDDAAGFILRHEPFKLGHLTGAMARVGNLSRLGDLPPQWRVQLGQAAREHGTALFIVWSYGTPIAWGARSLAVVPQVRYSLTTTQHQHLVATAWSVSFQSFGEGSESARVGKGQSPYGPREGWRP